MSSEQKGEAESIAIAQALKALEELERVGFSSKYRALLKDDLLQTQAIGNVSKDAASGMSAGEVGKESISESKIVEVHARLTQQVRELFPERYDLYEKGVPKFIELMKAELPVRNVIDDSYMVIGETGSEHWFVVPVPNAVPPFNAQFQHFFAGREDDERRRYTLQRPCKMPRKMIEDAMQRGQTFEKAVSNMESHLFERGEISPY